MNYIGNEDDVSQCAIIKAW